MTKIKPMIIFATHGPIRNDHELATKRYFTMNGLDAAAIVLFEDFDDALRRMDT